MCFFNKKNDFFLFFFFDFFFTSLDRCFFPRLDKSVNNFKIFIHSRAFTKSAVSNFNSSDRECFAPGGFESDREVAVGLELEFWFKFK